MALVLKTDTNKAAEDQIADWDFGNRNDEEQEAAEFLKKDENVERMETAFESYNAKALHLMASQDPETVERNVFKEVVIIQQHRFYGCLSLPFSMFFFLLFAQSSFLHEDVTAVYLVEAGLRSALGKGAVEVEDMAQLWDWMNTTLVDNMWTQVDLQGKEYDDKSYWGRVLMYNQLVGPVVLEQQRSMKALCDAAQVVEDMMCYDRFSKSKDPYGRNASFGKIKEPCNIGENSTCPMEYAGGAVTLDERREYYDYGFKPSVEEGRRLRYLDSSYTSYVPGATKAPGDGEAFEVFLYPTTRTTLVREHLQYLRDRGWIDEQSKQLRIKMLLLNAEVGRPRVEQVKIVFSFSRAGGIFFRMDAQSIFLKFWDGMLSMGCDFVWFVCLCLITGLETKGLVVARRTRETCKRFKSLWSALQWMIIGLGWMVVMCYLYQSSLLSSMMKTYDQVVEAQVNDMPADTNEFGADLHLKADNMVFFNSYFRILIAEYHLLLMIRFFTAFHAQPRLGVVTSTLEVSLIDIIHFLVVVVPTFLAYAVSGTFIFGRRMEDFATIEGALGVCFKILMESEYDWPDLTEEHWWTAAFWTWSFMFLLAMLMLNMVLAIVLDVYTEMRKKSGNSEEVWKTIYHLTMQIMHRRDWVQVEELLQKADQLPVRFSRNDILKVYPGMCEHQLGNLMKTCMYQAEVAQATTSGKASDAMKMAMAVKLIVDKVNDTTHQLYEGTIKSGQGPAQGKTWLSKVAKEMSVQNHMMLTVQWQLKQIEWQWQAMEAVHGEGVKFDGAHEAPAAESDLII